MIDICFVRYRIIVGIFQVVGQVFGVGGDIVPGQFFEIRIIQQPDRLISKRDAFGVKEGEKRAQINRVCEAGKCSGRYSNRPDEIRARLRKLTNDFTDLENPLCIGLFLEGRSKMLLEI